MKTIDAYKQYFSAECVYNGVARKGAVVTLTATSDSGNITYEACVSFFPHREETDFSISYDAFASEILYSAKGRRAKKREAVLLAELKEHVDALAAGLGGTVHWDKPLRDAVYG